MVDRSLVVKGPAIVQFKSYNFYSEGDIEVPFESETDKVVTSMYGTLDEVLLGRKVTVGFTPTEIEDTALVVTHPYFSTVVGTSLYGATDTPLVIWSSAGKKITFSAAAVTKMPDLNLASKGNPLGAIEFTCIGKNNAAWSDAASIAAVTSVAWADPGTFALTSRLNQIYTGSWAASGAWASFQTKDGFKISFNLETDTTESDADGLIDITFKSLEVMVKCTPFPAGASPIAETEILAGMGWQGTGAARGKSLSSMSSAHDLTVTGSATAAQSPKQLLTATLTKAQIKTAGMAFGTTRLRNGEVGWTATRTFTGSTVNSLCSLILS